MAFQSKAQIAPQTLEYVTQVAKDAPLHVQIRESLRQLILTGQFKPGDRIPSEEDLAKDWQVNRLTARRSVSDLVNEGLLQRRPGVGTFVIGRKFLRDQSSLVSFWEATKALGMEPSARLIGQEETGASLDVAEPLDLSEGDPVYCIRRLRLADGEVLAYHIAYLPSRLFPGLLARDLASLSLYAVYRAHGHPPVSGEQRIEAQAADRETAGLLGIPPRSPVLCLQRITRSLNRRPIEFLFAYLRSDRNVIYMPLMPSAKMALGETTKGKGRIAGSDSVFKGNPIMPSKGPRKKS